MSLELIYTSVPRGLKPGSQGFCTVASTRGIPPNLTQQLESLSGYRHVYPPQNSQTSRNPIAFSHLVISVGGRRCHVLSLVCDAGLDYTQRTNKFAHHVVLDAAEVPPAGPAWLLAKPGFMRSKWEGEPCNFPAGPAIPMSDCPPRVCHAWQRLTGDAGWGGVLAETAARSANQQAVLIFQPGTDVLSLLAESVALLPVELRWRATFSTYFTKLPPGITCQWRCVMEGTPEAATTRKSSSAGLLINLCRPLGPAPGGSYAEAARTGEAPRAVVVKAPPPNEMELEQALREDSQLRRSAAAGVYPLASPVAGGGYPLTPPPSVASVRPPAYLQFRPQRKQPSRLLWVLGIVVLVLLIVGGGLALWLANSGTQQPVSTAVVMLTPGGLSKDSGQLIERDRAKNQREKPADQPGGTKTVPAISDVGTGVTVVHKGGHDQTEKRPEQHIASGTAGKSQPVSQSQRAPAAGGPTPEKNCGRGSPADVALQGKQSGDNIKTHTLQNPTLLTDQLARIQDPFVLPRWKGPSSADKPSPMGLLGKVDNVKFAIAAFDVLPKFELKQKDRNSWECVAARDTDSSATIAKIFIQDGQLTFSWIENRFEHANLLRYCLLTITAPHCGKKTIHLRKRTSTDSLKLWPALVSASSTTAPTKLEIDDLPPNADVYLDLRFPPGQFLKKRMIKGKVEAEFTVSFPNLVPNKPGNQASPESKASLIFKMEANVARDGASAVTDSRNGPPSYAYFKLTYAGALAEGVGKGKDNCDPDRIFPKDIAQLVETCERDAKLLIRIREQRRRQKRKKRNAC